MAVVNLRGRPVGAAGNGPHNIFLNFHGLPAADLGVSHVRCQKPEMFELSGTCC